MFNVAVTGSWVDLMLPDILKNVELASGPDGAGYASILAGSRREAWRVSSSSFKSWLAEKVSSQSGDLLTNGQLNALAAEMQKIARSRRSEHQFALRVKEHDGAIYLDLGDADRRCVAITRVGWEVVESCPIRFYRTEGMLSMAAPEKGGTIEGFRPFINATNEREFTLLMMWLVAALRGRGPYPVLVVAGEHGTAKSTLSRFVQRLVDPGVGGLAGLSKNERDLFTRASNTHLLVFDNVSQLPANISDVLCRISGGGSFITTHDRNSRLEEYTSAELPVLINGTSVSIRPDLADRAIFITLDPIDVHKPLNALEDEFERARPYLLGVLLDGLVEYLRNMHKILDVGPSRMADFARVGVASETAFWASGKFKRAYQDNLVDAANGVLEDEPVALALREYLIDRKKFEGTAQQLLIAITSANVKVKVGETSWPMTPRALGGVLRRLAPALRKTGIELHYLRKAGGNRDRIIHVSVSDLASPVERASKTERVRLQPARSLFDIGADHTSQEAGGAAGTIGTVGTIGAAVDTMVMQHCAPLSG